MITKIINKYREENGKKPVEYWNKILCDFCFAHVLAMIYKGELYHTPDYYLKDYSEIVACCDFRNTWEETFEFLIFQVIGGSEEHRKILLQSQEIGYGILSDKNKVFITIRGK